MNVLITGSSGYIGRTLVKKIGNSCQRGNMWLVDTNIYNQESVPHPVSWNVFHMIYDTDVRSYREMERLVAKADIIIPLAAIVGMPACDKNPQEAIDVNTESIRRLVKMLSPEQRLIYPNTNSGYGVGPDGMCTEETPLNPVSVYGTSKCEAEKIVLDHPNSLVFRLATVFGVSPRMRIDLLVNDLVFRAFFDKKISVFEPHARRNYVHVKDVAEAFYWAINNGGQQQVYNFGNDEANSTKLELVKLIREYLDFTYTINNDKEDPDKRDYYVSSQKLKGAGFQAEISLRMGIAELIRFYKGHMKEDSICEVPRVPTRALELMRNA
jgi:nucleoside-diphosphate-sugar epimerase